jgi:hypothetical protein
VKAPARPFIVPAKERQRCRSWSSGSGDGCFQ